MAKIKTHFEQVPLSEIQQVVQADEIQAGKRKQDGSRNIRVKRPTVKTEPYSVRKND